MYCSQCGKKVMDTMLFCPFCGSPIVIPEQEEQNPAVEIAETVDEPAVDAEDAVLEEDDGGEFEPLNVDSIDAKEDVLPEQEHAEARDVSEEVSDILRQQLRQEPVRLQGVKPDLSAARQSGAPQIASPRRNADTLVPQRKFDPNDIFMDGVDEEDDYDYDDEDYDYDYEEREEGGFWVRHIRGLVSLVLLLVVAAVLIGWSFSNSGQQALARADLAWRPSAYAEIAYDAYQKGNYTLAGRYYTSAVERDLNNYDYASSAAVAYYMAQDAASAERMAREAIRINPSRVDAYELLLRLYPDASLRPMEIQNLLQQGYERTGDSRLNTAQ